MKVLTAVVFTLLAASASAQQMTNTCYFLVGRAAGSTRRFAGYPPIAVGSTCNDGAGSFGVAVPDGVRNPMGRFAMNGSDNPSCTDLLGTQVPYQLNSNIPKSGLATIAGNRPMIFLRGEMLQTFSPPVKRFLYAHECGHHALGQVIAAFYFQANLGPREELAADCFAGNTLKRIGRLSADDWSEVLRFIRTIPGDPTTLDGPRRVQELQNCVD
jgi:hypothetical protein